MIDIQYDVNNHLLHLPQAIMFNGLTIKGLSAPIDSDLETKIKVRHLVFPNGIFWDHEKWGWYTPICKGLILNNL